MTDNNDPGPEVPSAPEPPSAAAAPVAPAKRTWRERLAGSEERAYGLRGLVAATLAALMVGGVGGAAIHAAVDGEGHEQRRFSRGEHPDGPDGPGDFDRRGPGDFDRRGPAPLPPSLPAPGESSDS